MWLACHTQENIAEAVDTSQQNVAVLLKEFQETGLVKLTENQKAAASHITDFGLPLYNVWKFKDSQGVAWLSKILI